MKRLLSPMAVLVLTVAVTCQMSYARQSISARQIVTFGVHRTFAKAVVFQKTILSSVSSPSLQVQTSTITSTKVTAGLGREPASTVPARDSSTLSRLRTATFEPELLQEQTFSEAGMRLRDSRRSSFIFTITE
ncbi:MAG: hypothetical protein WBD36_10640 [Bacteroidota bacterium]